VRGTWRTARGRGSTLLDIELHRRVSTKDKAVPETARAGILRSAVPHDRHDPRFTHPV
jgi:hypothetical protein